MREPEEMLAARAIEGDETSLVELLGRHGPVVAGRLQGSVPRRWRAILTIEDVMQEAYTDAFLGIGHFEWRGEGSFAAWLSTISRRTLLDAVRLLEAGRRGGDRQRVEPDSHEDLCARLGWTTTTPSRIAAREEARTALASAIEALPPDHRRAIELYDLQGCPIEELASLLGRSPGAVHMLRLRAHRLLADRLGTTCGFSRSPA